MNAHSIDRGSILLLAIFPSLAISLLNQFYLEAVYQQGQLWFYLADACQWIVTPVLVWLFVLRPANIKPKDYGLRVPVLGVRPLETLGLFLFIAVLLWISYSPVYDIAYRFLWKYAGTFSYGNAAPKSFPWNALVVFYYAVTAAFVEEVVFRGLPWIYFSIAVSQPRRKFWYITITSILFAASHSEQGPHGMIAALSFGIVSAMLYIELKNLWPLVFGHFVCDVISFWPK
jgi:hypothetical protein